ncbi:glycosyltransferase [Patescibacteria group bacterium]|nr:MAG: glycosyltransferase [Patescibacteria group bacterium]
MRILFTVPYFAPAWSFGGPVKVVYDLCKEFIRLGHEVTVATTDVLTVEKRHNKKTDLLDGINVVYFKNISNFLAYKANLYLPIGFRAWLKKNIYHYNIIHCHDLYSGLNVHVSQVAPKFRVPFIVQPHGALNEIRMNAQMKTPKILFLKIFANILKLSSAIIVSTNTEKNNEINRISQTLARKTHVVPNGLNTSQLTQSKPNPALRSRLRFKPDEKMIIYFGRIQYIKGLDITLRALALIKDIPYKFVIIGRDEGALSLLKELAENLCIKDRVIFFESMFGKDLSEYLETADLFVFNSRSESLPMAVLDACAAALPVIISSDCNLPEVEIFGAGIVLKNNTPEDTAEAIRRYFKEPKKQIIMRQKCHSLIANYFNLTTIAKQHLTLYGQIVKTR